MLALVQDLQQQRTVKYRQASRLLKKLGFTRISCRGTHERWKHPRVPEAFILIYKDEDIGVTQFRKLISYVTRWENEIGS